MASEDTSEPIGAFCDVTALTLVMRDVYTLCCGVTARTLLDSLVVLEEQQLQVETDQQLQSISSLSTNITAEATKLLPNLKQYHELVQKLHRLISEVHHPENIDKTLVTPTVTVTEATTDNTPSKGKIPVLSIDADSFKKYTKKGNTVSGNGVKNLIPIPASDASGENVQLQLPKSSMVIFLKMKGSQVVSGGTLSPPDSASKKPSIPALAVQVSKPAKSNTPIRPKRPLMPLVQLRPDPNDNTKVRVIPSNMLKDGSGLKVNIKQEYTPPPDETGTSDTQTDDYPQFIGPDDGQIVVASTPQYLQLAECEQTETSITDVPVASEETVAARSIMEPMSSDFVYTLDSTIVTPDAEASSVACKVEPESYESRFGYSDSVSKALPTVPEDYPCNSIDSLAIAAEIAVNNLMREQARQSDFYNGNQNSDVSLTEYPNVSADHIQEEPLLEGMIPFMFQEPITEEIVISDNMQDESYVESYACEECGMHFSEKEGFVEHLKYCAKDTKNVNGIPDSTGTRPFATCSKCGQGFRKKLDFIEHYRICQTEYTQSCNLCPARFKSWLQLRRHKKRAHFTNVERPCQCPFCPSRFSTSYFLRGHLQRMHRQKIEEGKGKQVLDGLTLYQGQAHTEGGRVCPICKARFPTRTAKEEHLKEHPELMTKKCEECDHVFTSEIKYKQHMEKHGEKRVPCEVCGKCFSNKARVYRHMRDEHKFHRGHSCDICGASYISDSGLRCHMRRKHKSTKHDCHICGASLSSQDTLISHLRTHTGLRPHKCHVCEKSFSDRSVLTNHMRIHTGEKPFLCPYCGKAFRQRGHIIAHTRGARGCRPGAVKVKDLRFQCGVCEKIFKDRPVLEAHIRIHTDERPFECDVCGKSFRQRGHLFTHKRGKRGCQPAVEKTMYLITLSQS